MSDKQSPRPLRQFIWANLAYVFSGKLRLKKGYLPSPGHDVPQDFAGVGVATSENVAVDDYVIDRLHELGIRQVRLDFTYGDVDNHVARFLKRLCAASFNVTLHLVQPLYAAKDMHTKDARETWRDFVAATAESFGARIGLMEIGSTINRKRWSGYTLDGFLTAWGIAHDEIRERNIKLAGPNITDFEPMYNIGILSVLKNRGQLPDIHTDNLFSERSTEPERSDHKVLGRKLAAIPKLNLIKKARLLQKIGANYGVPVLYSPTAFWTLPRIRRLLSDDEEKQADYLARYMILCAASGSVNRAFWGPLVCHREGLIDDGNSTYPALERVTHYADIAGDTKDYCIRPAFHAFKTFIQMIPDSRYQEHLSSSKGLELHAFTSNQHLIHAAWTINGCTAALSDIYMTEDLSAAQFITRDGEKLEATPDLITESPLYLQWPLDRAVTIKPDAGLLKDLSIHAHAKGTYVLFRQNNWQGLLLAKDNEEAAVLRAAMNPEHIGAPPIDALLRNARNAVWTIPDPTDATKKLVVKQPARVRPYKRLLNRFRPPKALRSWNGANELLRRGIETARPVAYFEKIGDTSLIQNYYICEYVETDFSARKIFSAFAAGEKTYQEITEEDAYSQLCDYLIAMHNRGIYFRDLSGGNILIRKSETNKLIFSLIDTGRAHYFNHATPLSKRISDLARVCNKLHPAGRDRFMILYMEKLGRHFGFWQRLPFYLYNAKVILKRRLKRKNLIKLFKQRDIDNR